MPARSLLAMSTRVAVQNVRSLTDIGNIPYSLARPFLIKVESPKQLRELEKNSPHIMQDDRELWMDFIKRDIPQWEQYDIPQESDCWYDIYCDLLEQVQREVEEGALQLKQAVDKFYSDKANNAAVLVKDTSRLPKPRRRFHTSGTRSEPKKNSIFSSKRNKVLAVPTHQLHSGASRINHVPQWLVDEHKQAPSSPTTLASKPTSKPIQPSTGRQSQASSPPRVSAPRPRVLGRPSSVSATDKAKSEMPTGSRPIVPGKRGPDRSPPRTLSSRSEPVGTPPVRASPASPAKPLIRKRPAASQPNIFIQKKRRI
ncbi:RNA polymerase II transcription factor SIII (Elongin) subunit A, putative [Talaromyces stipitatus ATCC 10500]|uniref:RNA polymerase II transcription factor SIII (Elongin) subunit A, putative n=1 Tax=Talaromyces stipitatus (strain ATCC 10500 / CBS 375.48 / QM 6759 / NRRL 1006) TaxID=441959 RepID=B8M1E5_TALSN|nr:RNA polymerase II transcription factor SIII (Elongin) subunit A, putative [Talaromyces stipitatus ATCC 10500]EED21841.1 RNA polymerase II transcription factor SIII (Elongin) subunit A, putative [Talaromyces stipitatus ATCC 10500]